jgi:hypothetical protein
LFSVSITPSGFRLLAVHGDRVALLEIDLTSSGLFGAFSGETVSLNMSSVGRVPGILEDAALVADVQQVAVHRIGLLGGDRDGNLVLPRSRAWRRVGAGLEIPDRARGR